MFHPNMYRELVIQKLRNFLLEVAFREAHDYAALAIDAGGIVLDELAPDLTELIVHACQTTSIGFAVRAGIEQARKERADTKEAAS